MAGAGGAAAAIGAGSALADYAGELVGNLQAAGVDVADAAAIRAALKNPAVLANISEQASRHAGVVGGFDALSAGLAGKSLLPGLFADKLLHRPLAAAMANIALQLPVQAGLGAAGEAGGELAAGQAVQPGQVLAEAFAELFGAPVEAVTASGKRLHTQFDEAKRAEIQAAKLDELTEMAAASKVLRRDPDLLKRFVDEAVLYGGEGAAGLNRDEGVAAGLNRDEGVAPTSLYIEAMAFAESGVAEQVTALLPDLARQLPEALAAGGEIRIPLGDYLSKIALSPYAKILLDDVRVAGGTFSSAQARQYKERRGEDLRAELDRIISGKRAEDAYQAQLPAVREAVQRQLQEAGLFSDEVNADYAVYISHFYAAQAKRFGVSPEQLFDEYPLRVTAEDLSEINPFEIDQVEQNREGEVYNRETQDSEAWNREARNRENRDNENRDFFRPDNSRGAYHLQSRRIMLHKNADLSTFLHEAAHFFLDMQFDLARRVEKQSAAEENAQKDGAVFYQRGLSDLPVKTPDDFTDEILEAMTNNKAPPGRYSSKTRFIVERTRLLGTDTVKTAADAAQALAPYLAKFATERLDVLVTDKQGKPLAVVGAFKGTRISSPSYPDTISAEVFRIKQAARIWLVHNHPSGFNYISHGDRRVNAQILAAFSGSRIKPAGIIALTGRGSEWAFEPKPKLYFEPRHTPSIQKQDELGRTAPPGNRLSVPVLELVMGDDSSLGEDLDERMPKSYAVSLAQGESGLLLMDNGYFPKAFLPLKDDEGRKLRIPGRLDGLYRAISIANASDVLVINFGDLSEAAITNLAGFFNTHNMRIRDVLDVNGDTFASRSEQWQRYDTQKYFYQGPAGAGVSRPQNAGLAAEGAAGYDGGVNGPQQLLADTRILLDWFGVESLDDWGQLDFQQRRRYHELFAESFERYLAEGKAPSPALHSLFERFRIWLLEIYKSLMSMNAEVTDELRGVFGRMLAG